MQLASSLDSRWPDLIAAISGAIDIEATARSSGALVRRRAIRSGEMLLRLALAYGPGGLSLRAAAAWAGMGGLADLSDTAVMKRMRSASAWLGEVAGALVRRAAADAPGGQPGALQGRRLRISDGSVITRPGSKGPDWRLHAVYEPAAGRFTGLELTDGRGAEGFGRAEFAPGDVAMGDRAYARPPALRRILDGGADFIVRTGWARLRLLAEDGTPVAWDAVFDNLAPGQIAERAVSVVHAGGGEKVLFRARLVVLRLSPQATARAARALHRSQSRRRAGKPLQPLTVRSTGYLMLLTSLPSAIAATEVLAAYRLRWQVELAFKRLKGLLGLDRLPARSEPLARSWLLAHLILALLIDDASQALLDSPPCAGSGASSARLAVAHCTRAA
jgi:Transposase DDE domain